MDESAAPRPELRTHWHVGYATRKDEDVSIVATSKSFSSGVALYAVADGHNGPAAARHVQAALPAELERQLGAGPGAAGPASVLRGLARTFVAVDDAVCRQHLQSGCTLTAAVVAGDVLTLANVGDSRAVLDTGAEVIELSCDHRIGNSPAELARLEAAGGRLARLNEWGSGPSASHHEGLGPVRLWPGGVMVGRAVGDRDVGDILLAAPALRQVRIPPTGARLVIASDGLWDSMPAGRVARLLRQQPTAKGAALAAVSAAATARNGLLADDVTVVIVDLLPPSAPNFGAVLAQFQRRMRAVLSSPVLATLALAEAEEDAAAARAAGEDAARRAADEAAAAAHPRRRGSGLFRCFSRPAVLEDGAASREPSARGGSARGGSPRGDCSAYSGRGDFSAYSGRGELSTRSGISLRGGSERSVRAGCPRDPSVRGYLRATSVEVLAAADAALWAPSDYGHAPSLSCQSCSDASADSPIDSGAVGRASPRSLLDAYGHSVASMSSEDDPVGHAIAAAREAAAAARDAPRLPRALSLAAGQRAVAGAPLSRKLSAPEGREKKCHGGSAAAALLAHS